MLFAIIAAVVSIAAAPQPQWIAPTPAPPDGPQPAWIWGEEPGGPAPTAGNAPAGAVYLARAFDAPPGRATARLFLAADNHAIAYLNGMEVLRSDAWSSVVSAEVVLRDGPNVLAIKAVNDAIPGARPEKVTNPGGVIARLAISRVDGSTDWIVTDSTWAGSTQPWPGFPADPPRDMPASAVLGPGGIAPWSLPAGAFTPARPCPMLRRSFVLPVAPTGGAVRIIGLGHYELRCNG